MESTVAAKIEGLALDQQVKTMLDNRRALATMLGEVLATLSLPANRGGLQGEQWEMVLAGWIKTYNKLDGA